MKQNIAMIGLIIALAALFFFLFGGPQFIYDIQHPLVRVWTSTDNVGVILQEIEDNDWIWCSAVTCGNWTELSYRK